MASKAQRPSERSDKVWWWVAAVIVLAGGALLLSGRSPSARGQHPSPRPLVTAERVMPGSLFGDPRTSRAYAIAAAIPAMLDGIYCYCDCSKHSGHRSLLTCFEDRHGSQCNICMSQAELAYRLSREGRTLEEIRTAIDRTYGS